MEALLLRVVEPRHAVKRQCAVRAGLAVSRDRELATAAECVQERALGGDRVSRRRIVQRARQLQDVAPVGPRLQRQRPLARRRQHGGERQRRHDQPAHIWTQALEPRRGEDESGPFRMFAKFPQSRVDVAADRLGAQIAPQGADLRRPARAAREQNRAGGKLLQRRRAARDQHVAHIGARGNGSQRQPLRVRGGQVLEAVHRQVDLAQPQRAFQLAGEKPLRQHPAERPSFLLGKSVALRLDDAQFQRAVWPRLLQLRHHLPRLRQGQRAAPATKNDRVHVGTQLGRAPAPPWRLAQSR